MCDNIFVIYNFIVKCSFLSVICFTSILVIQNLDIFHDNTSIQHTKVYLTVKWMDFHFISSNTQDHFQSFNLRIFWRFYQISKNCFP